jgi:hypothetical protein
MCKPVADKTETAVAYLAAGFWFVGSRISLVALHGVLPQATRAYTDIASCGADPNTSNNLTHGGSAAKPGGRQLSKTPRRMPREFFMFGYEGGVLNVSP